MINIEHGEYFNVSSQDPKKDFYLSLMIDHFFVSHPFEENKRIGPAKREFVLSRPSVGILVHCLREGMVLMSRQFRVPVFHQLVQEAKQKGITPDLDALSKEAWIYEIVAGVVDDGESDEQTAIREAEEEAGVTVLPEQLIKVGKFYPSPGMTSEYWTVFTCPIYERVPLRRIGGLASEHEAIVSEWLTVDEVRTLLKNGQIKDAKTFIALKSMGL